MSRLTEWCDGQAIPRMDLRKNGYKRCLNKLAEYEDLADDGKLLELPCAPKTKYFEVESCFWSDREKCEDCKEYYEGSVYADDCPSCRLEMNNKPLPSGCLGISEKIFGSVEHILSRMGDIGKTIFFASEEAEKALEEMRGSK